MQQFRVRQLWTLSGALVCASVFAACGQPAPSASSSASAAGDVWATVDNRPITKTEVEKAYQGAIDPTAAPPTDDEAIGAKLSVLDELITQDVLLARAKTLSIAPTDAEVDKGLADRKQGMTDPQFQLQLSTRGLTVDDVKQTVRRDLTLQKLFDKEVGARIAVAEPDIAAFYAKNRAQFDVKEPQFRLAQIVVAPGRNPQLSNRLGDDAVTPAEVDAKVKMISEKLRTGGAFAELAADYSEDSQVAANGGDLGLMPQSSLDRLPPQLKATVLKMVPGSANVVSSNGTFAIVMLVERAPAGLRELTSPGVHDGIRDLMKSQKERVARSAYIASARDDAKIVNNLARQVLAALPPAAPAAPAPAAASPPAAAPAK